MTDQHFATADEEMQADLDEQAYFEREEAELDDRQRMWAEEAHQLMHDKEQEDKMDLRREQGKRP